MFWPSKYSTFENEKSSSDTTNIFSKAQDPIQNATPGITANTFKIRQPTLIVPNTPNLNP
jgi:hypothetical protein